MKRNPQDLSEAEVRERLCPALRVTFDQLADLDFPEAVYIVDGQKHWTFEPVALWVDARVRSTLHFCVRDVNMVDVVQLVFWMKGAPDVSRAEAMHLASSALVDMQMRRIFGRGMREASTALGQGDQE